MLLIFLYIFVLLVCASLLIIALRILPTKDLTGPKHLIYINEQGYISGKELLSISVVAALIFTTFMAFLLFFSNIYFSQKHHGEKEVVKDVDKKVKGFEEKKEKAIKKLKKDLQEWRKT
jgi:hypothetical protein